jgi:hypothetical protein
MVRIDHLCIAAVVAFALTTSVAGQLSAQGDSRRASLTGIVRDSLGDRAPARTRVCAIFSPPTGTRTFRCAGVDSLGNYRLDSLPPAQLRVWAECSGPTTTQGFAYDSISFAADAPRHRDWLTDSNRCDQRPLRHVTRLFEGVFVSAFESSRFYPCVSSSWVIPSDTMGLTAKPPYVGVSITLPLESLRGSRWPQVPRDSVGVSRYYMKWHGTLVGPNVRWPSAFGVSVDSILEVRAWRDDCAIGR